MKIKHIIILIIACLLTGAGVYLFLNKDKLLFHAGVGDYQVNWNTNTAPVTFVDDSGRSHSLVNVVEVPKQNLTDIAQLVNLTNEIKGLKKNLSNLESYVSIVSQTTASGTVLVIDTSYTTKDLIVHKDREFSFKNKYDTLTILIEGDSAKYKLIHTEKLSNALYFDKKWLLGKKHYKNEIINENPNSKIIYQAVVKAARKKGLFK